MIDCHAHLGAGEFDGDRAAVIGRARKAGVDRVIVVSEDGADSHKTLDICECFPDVLSPALGLHPDRFGDRHEPPGEVELEAICTLIREQRQRLVAIGEVGLDYWVTKDETRRAAQRAFLARLASLAAELDLPLNVHCRSAGKVTLEVLREAGARRVLMHAFDGKAGHALAAAEELGYIFSIPPSVVRSRQKQKLVRLLPLEALALESDSPVLGPEPDQRNEPANVAVSLETIAAIKAVDPEEVRLRTTENARRLFRIEPRSPAASSF